MSELQQQQKQKQQEDVDMQPEINPLQPLFHRVKYPQQHIRRLVGKLSGDG